MSLTLIFCSPPWLNACSTSFFVAAGALVKATVNASRQAALSVSVIVMGSPVGFGRPSTAPRTRRAWPAASREPIRSSLAGRRPRQLLHHRAASQQQERCGRDGGRQGGTHQQVACPDGAVG